MNEYFDSGKKSIQIWIGWEILKAIEFEDISPKFCVLLAFAQFKGMLGEAQQEFWNID